MPNLDLGYRPSGAADGETVPVGPREFDAAIAAYARDIRARTQPERDRLRLARDLAEIERATAALRKGVPTLESWSGDAPVVVLRKPRPLWLMIGVLWLSTALVTVGAVAAIARLVG